MASGVGSGLTLTDLVVAVLGAGGGRVVGLAADRPGRLGRLYRVRARPAGSSAALATAAARVAPGAAALAALAALADPVAVEVVGTAVAQGVDVVVVGGVVELV